MPVPAGCPGSPCAWLSLGCEFPRKAEAALGVRAGSWEVTPKYRAILPLTEFLGFFSALDAEKKNEKRLGFIIIFVTLRKAG